MSISYATGSVSGTDYIGGLVGLSDSTSNADSCYATGSVDGNFNVGGLVGCNEVSTISSCYATGSVDGSYCVGGMVGDTKSSTVSNSHATGIVTGTGHVGGLVGHNYWYSNIINSYATGSVTGISDVGGLVGRNWNSEVSNSYAIGFSSGISNVGGLVGFNNVTAENSFWDTEISGQSSSAGGTGKTTAEMKNVATFTDLTTVGLDIPWDFVGNPYDDTGTEDYWNINGTTNDGYPFLSWQGGVVPPTNVIITITGNDIELSWDDMSATTYYIYRSTDPYAADWGVAIGISMVNSYTDYGAAVSGNKYFYYVTASD